MSEGPKIEGPTSKPYERWRVDADGARIQLLASGNTRDDLRHIRRRLDWHYQVYFKGRPMVTENPDPK